MPTSTEVSKLLEDEANGADNQEQTFNGEKADNAAPEQNFFDLALKLDGGDEFTVQLDGLPPIDFDASFTDLLDSQQNRAHVKHSEESPIAARNEVSTIPVNDFGIEHADSRKVTKIVGEALDVMPLRNPDEDLYSTQSFTNLGSCTTPAIDVSQAPSVQLPDGRQGSTGVYTIPTDISPAQQVSVQQGQNVTRTYTSQSEHMMPSRHVVCEQGLRSFSSKLFSQAEIASPYSTRQYHTQQKFERIGSHDVRPPPIEDCRWKGLAHAPFTNQPSPNTCSSASPAPPPLLDEGHLATRGSATLSAQTASNLTEGQRASKTRYSKGAAPSHYCHICGRNSRIEFAKCHNLRLGLCRKVICEKCLILYEPESRSLALDPNSDWKCTHCREKCPERARCKQYTQNNQKRREKKARERQEKEELQQKEKTAIPEAALRRDGAEVLETEAANLSRSVKTTTGGSSESSVPEQYPYPWPLPSNVADVTFLGAQAASRESQSTMPRSGEIQAAMNSNFFTAPNPSDLPQSTGGEIRSASAYQTCPAASQACNVHRKSPQPDRILSVEIVSPQQLSTYGRQQALQLQQSMSTESYRQNIVERMSMDFLGFPNREDSAPATGEEFKRPQFQRIGRETSGVQALQSAYGQERKLFPQTPRRNVGENVMAQMLKQDECTEMDSLDENSMRRLRSQSPRKRKREVEGRKRGDVLRRRSSGGRRMTSLGEDGRPVENIFYQERANKNSVCGGRSVLNEQAGPEEVASCAQTNALEPGADTICPLENEFNEIDGGFTEEEGGVLGRQAEKMEEGVSPTGIMSSVFKGNIDYRQGSMEQ